MSYIPLVPKLTVARIGFAKGDVQYELRSIPMLRNRDRIGRSGIEPESTPPVGAALPLSYLPVPPTPTSPENVLFRKAVLNDQQ